MQMWGEIHAVTATARRKPFLVVLKVICAAADMRIVIAAILFIRTLRVLCDEE